MRMMKTPLNESPCFYTFKTLILEALQAFLCRCVQYSRKTKMKRKKKSCSFYSLSSHSHTLKHKDDPSAHSPIIKSSSSTFLVYRCLAREARIPCFLKRTHPSLPSSSSFSTLYLFYEGSEFLTSVSEQMSENWQIFFLDRPEMKHLPLTRKGTNRNGDKKEGRRRGIGARVKFSNKVKRMYMTSV